MKLSKIFPSIEEIKRQKVQPTKGEWKLLNFLSEYLDDSLEVYYQPFLNGLRPDIVLMKKRHGVVVIEVKDWNLDLYYTKEGFSNKDWFLKENDALLMSPFEQVNKYKDSLFNVYINNLNEKKALDKNYYGIINTLVYFDNNDINKFNNVMRNSFSFSGYYLSDNKYNYCLTEDLLSKSNFNELMKKMYISSKRESKYFTDDIYESFKREFMPPKHVKEEGKEIIYTSEQKKFIESKPEMKKIKGFVGSGKTLILAKRAVNAYKRTNDDVLILTFNITLKNYIHDKISEIRDNFPWNKFIIKNYHIFIKESLLKAGIKLPPISEEASQKEIDEHYHKYFNDLEFFKTIKNKLKKYKVILIDEVQDYEKSWLDILKNVFLEENGEYILFGDEKQNVYRRELDKDKTAKTNIVGPWNKLTESFRVTNKVATLSLNFQKYFFTDKYEFEKFENKNKNKNKASYIDYFELDKKDLNKKLFEYIEKIKIHRSDIAILGSKINDLRILDQYYRLNYNFKTTKTFEAEEIYQVITENVNSNTNIKNKENVIENRLEQERKSKKYNFWIKKDGLLKISTINSFKGMEIDTVILIISEEDDNDELIYTGITRARENLIIFNLGNERYKKFFLNNQFFFKK
jgi:hypothetical protein